MSALDFYANRQQAHHRHIMSLDSHANKKLPLAEESVFYTSPPAPSSEVSDNAEYEETAAVRFVRTENKLFRVRARWCEPLGRWDIIYAWILPEGMEGHELEGSAHLRDALFNDDYITHLDDCFCDERGFLSRLLGRSVVNINIFSLTSPKDFDFEDFLKTEADTQLEYVLAHPVEANAMKDLRVLERDRVNAEIRLENERIALARIALARRYAQHGMRSEHRPTGNGARKVRKWARTVHASLYKVPRLSRRTV